MPHMNPPCRRPRRPMRHGYTLVEVLIVIVIIGLAGAIVVPQMMTGTSLTIQAAARQVIADLMYAQNEAVAMQDTRTVVFEADQNRYHMVDGQGDLVFVNWKGGSAHTGNYVVNIGQDHRFSGVKIDAVSFAGQQQISFDDLGTPSQGGTIDLTHGETRYRITVAAFTGRITVERISGQ